MGTLTANGIWSGGYAWEIYLSQTPPDAALCTAVVCVAISDPVEEKVTLTCSERGWEVISGHIEAGETPEAALLREAQEEGGFTFDKASLFGYRKITASRPANPSSRASAYPYPVTFMPHYFAYASQARGEHFGKEVLGSGEFNLKEIREMAARGMVSETDLHIIESGLEAARASLLPQDGN